MKDTIDRKSSCEGFVLVGGAGSRMGRDKAQMVLGGQKLFERAINALSEICSGRVSLVGGQSDRFAGDSEFTFAVLPDLHDSGPNSFRASMVGLHTALLSARTDWLAVLACDLPFVTSDLITALAWYCSDKFEAVVPRQPDGRPQPLCAFYRRERCLPVVKECLRTGELKLEGFLSRISPRYVESDELANLDGSSNFFLNLNKPEDYETALEIVAF